MQPANDTARVSDPHRAARLAAEEQERAYQARHNWTGAKWQQGRDFAETAKLVRADLKAAGIVAKVRLSRYSMGRSLTVEVTPPAGMPLASVLRVRQDMRLAPLDERGCPAPYRSPESSALLAKVEGLVNAYNRSWNDRHQDFHAHVEFETGAQNADRERVEAALRAAYAVVR